MRKVLLLLAVLTVAACGSHPRPTTGATASSAAATSRQASTSQAPRTTPDPHEPLIAVNFVDLSQYASVSKFRSCEGHDFSGLNINGTPEAQRSMKHYFEALPAFAGTTGRLVGYAPFDGTVTMLEPDQRGSRLGISDRSEDGPHWTLVFFHTDPVSGLAVGSEVKAGQPVGYGNLSGGGINFDVALKWQPGGNSQEERFDSPFAHAGDAVLTEYRRHGLTVESLVISQQERDAAPCKQFGRNDANWVSVH